VHPLRAQGGQPCEKDGGEEGNGKEEREVKGAI
jgi:hypothetical protein